jgi:hypothetical protein
MSQVNATSGTQSVFATFSAHGSPQMALAMLQMELAKTNKDQAMSGIKEIENEQAKKKEMSDMLNKARDCKSAGLHLNDAGIPSGLDDNFVKYCQNNGITVPHYAKYADSKEDLDKKWDLAISQMQTKLDTVGANIQTQMVQLQDFMGQYNSYMQGANTAISTSNQVLTSLAKGQ